MPQNTQVYSILYYQPLCFFNHLVPDRENIYYVILFFTQRNRYLKVLKFFFCKMCNACFTNKLRKLSFC